MTDLISGSPLVFSVIDRDSAAGLRSVVKQHQTENYGVCEQLAELGSALLAEAPKGIPVVVWFGSRIELAPGHHGSAKALPRAASLCVGCCSVITHCTEYSLGPFTHLLLYVRLRA